MEFTLDTVNVEYRGVELVQYRSYRDRNRLVLRFYFYTDKFASMGILAKLKRVPGYLDFIKGHIHAAIRDMDDDMFDQARMHINNCHVMEYYRLHMSDRNNKPNIMRLLYSNSYKIEGRHIIAYEDSLESWYHPVHTREDLIRALLRVTQNSASK